MEVSSEMFLDMAHSVNSTRNSKKVWFTTSETRKTTRLHNRKVASFIGNP